MTGHVRTLPPLTTAELNALGRAVSDRLAVATAIAAWHVPDEGLAAYWRSEAALLESLNVAIAETMGSWTG